MVEEIIRRAPCGAVRGLETDGVQQFRGIPYAEAPVGERRFLPPVAKAAWSGVLDCTKQAPIPPQGPSDLDRPMGPLTIPQSEDCLTVTVSAPKDGENLPVAVWFHGGANFCGAGGIPWYDGRPLAKKEGIVVVCVNYRLGALGFLHSPALNERNLAIEDQVASLRWVRENIAAFGGDPDRVTVFGQSAGGNSIVHMLGLEETDGLFSRAFLLSPSIGRANFSTDEAHEVSETLLTALRIPSIGTPEAAAAVRGKTTAEILRATDRTFEKLGKKMGGMLFRPVEDRWTTPEATIEAAVEGAVRKGVVIDIGTTKEETLAFSSDRSAPVVERLRGVQRDRFDLPAWDFAAAAAKAGVAVRKHRFTWSARDSVYGSCHCLDLPFLFGTRLAWDAPMLAGATEDEVQALTWTLQHYFGLFVRGELTESEWPPFTAEDPVHLVADASGARILRIPRSEFTFQ